MGEPFNLQICFETTQFSLLKLIQKRSKIGHASAKVIWVFVENKSAQVPPGSFNTPAVDKYLIQAGVRAVKETKLNMIYWTNEIVHRRKEPPI